MKQDSPSVVADLQIQTTCQLLIAAVVVGGPSIGSNLS